MITHWCVALLLLLTSAMASAADPCPVSKSHMEWEAACFETVDAGRQVKPRYLKRLRFDRHGFATVIISTPRELVAVNRRGKVLVPGIRHTGDFDYPTAHLGIGRFSTSTPGAGGQAVTRCGYFLSKGFRIVVPAEYDHCQAFADGEALACKGCESVCTEVDCQNSVFVGGEGVALAPDGTVRRRFSIPDAQTLCASVSKEQLTRIKQFPRPLQCAGKSANPFNQLE